MAVRCFKNGRSIRLQRRVEVGGGGGGGGGVCACGGGGACMNGGGLLTRASSFEVPVSNLPRMIDLLLFMSTLESA